MIFIYDMIQFSGNRIRFETDSLSYLRKLKKEIIALYDKPKLVEPGQIVDVKIIGVNRYMGYSTK